MVELFAGICYSSNVVTPIAQIIIWKVEFTMEKTYRLLDHTDSLSIEEIERLYDGYWIYIVKAKFSEYNELLSGIPVVIGLTPSDGVEDGIYKKYRSEEYDIRADLNLLPNKGFISSLRVVADNAE